MILEKWYRPGRHGRHGKHRVRWPLSEARRATWHSRRLPDLGEYTYGLLTSQASRYVSGSALDFSTNAQKVAWVMDFGHAIDDTNTDNIRGNAEVMPDTSFLRPQACSRIGDLHTKCLRSASVESVSDKKPQSRTSSPLQDGDPVPAAHVVRNLGRKALVMHQEDVNVPYV